MFCGFCSYLCIRKTKFKDKNMKLLLTLVILFVCMSFTVDYLWIGGGIDEVKIFQSIINDSNMTSFTDGMYGYSISYPDFFEPAEDNVEGENRFNYNGRTDIMIETKVIASIKYLQAHSDKIKHVKDSLVIDGDYTEGDSTWENMRFHTKAVRSGKFWITYTLVFNKDFEKSLRRMISIIDQWNPKELVCNLPDTFELTPL